VSSAALLTRRHDSGVGVDFDLSALPVYFELVVTANLMNSHVFVRQVNHGRTSGVVMGHVEGDRWCCAPVARPSTEFHAVNVDGINLIEAGLCPFTET